MAVRIRADARRSVDAIHVAAREVLGRDAAPGLDEIAALAGVHRATLYRHFPSREALIASLYEAYLDDAAAAIAEADPAAEDLLAEIEALVRRIYEVNITWRPFAWAPAYAMQDDPRRAELARGHGAALRRRAGAGRAALRPVRPPPPHDVWRAGALLHEPHPRGRVHARRGRRAHARSC